MANCEPKFGVQFLKAVVWTKYGPPDVLQVREIKTPSPKNKELLIRIHTTTVTAGDCEQRSNLEKSYILIANKGH